MFKAIGNGFMRIVVSAAVFVIWIIMVNIIWNGLVMLGDYLYRKILRV